MTLRIFVSLISLFITLTCLSQSNPGVEADLQKQAEKDWQNENYKLAAASYEKLVAINKDNVEYEYRFGVSNFMAGFDTDKSLQALEPLIGNNSSAIDVMYWIAQVYMYKYEFADAIDMFNTFITSVGATKTQIAESKRFIEMCQSAIILMDKPVNVSFENLGPNINSTSNDFNPYVPQNEKFIIFTSDKKFDQISKMFDQNIYISYPEKMVGVLQNL